GAIRLVGNQVTGTGNQLIAVGGAGGYGGDGRIRIESNLDTGGLTGTPTPSLGLAGAQAALWPSNAPTIQVTFVGTHPAPADPHAAINFPSWDQNMYFTNPNPLTVTLGCTNVPSNSTVTVRVMPKRGQDYVVNASFTSGNTASSTWIAQLPTALPQDF